MQDKKKVVFVAGRPSHGYGAHEHNAGCTLLSRTLNENVPAVHAVLYRNGWPADPTTFDNADAIVIFSDGAGGHPMLPHLDALDKLMNKGVGLVCLHYAVDVPKGKPADCLQRWIGGHFEQFWSVNPHWTAEFRTLPQHPITRGVKPFAIEDEWYYHIRFVDDMKRVTPILTAVPPERTRQGKDGPYSGNPHVRSRTGMPEHVAWAYERPGGGRGFGFTGGHWHWNWGQPDFRRIVLNAIVWAAGAEVPAGGVPSKSLSLEELEADQDEPQPKDFDRDAKRELLRTWSGGALFDGRTLAGWKVLRDGPFEGTGAVRVENGAILLERGRLQTGITWTGEFPREEYEVSLEAMRVEGSDFFCGMTFPVGNEPCTLIVGGWGGTVVGLSNVDDQHAAENQTTRGMTFENGRWYSIQLRVTAERIEAWIGGSRVIDLERAGHRFSVWWEQERVRPFGVSTYDTTGALRNIRVRRLVAGEAE